MLKPIEGSWFEFQHTDAEGKYYIAALAGFTAQQWETKVREAAEIGMRHLVLMNVAMLFKSFYDTPLLPRFGIACDDPIEAVLSAADRYGIKFYMPNDYFDDCTNHGRNILDADTQRKRAQCMEELVARYGHHPSFHGWYWPIEAYLKSGYSDVVLTYVNQCSRIARSLTPDAPILIAPYGTGVVVADDHYVAQLDRLDVDIIAYQDEIGCLRHGVEDLPRFYEGLRIAHDKAQRAAFWSDIEIFTFEGNVGVSALLPAPFDRVRRQIEIASDYADVILIYQFQGMMNKPGSQAFAGHPDSEILYTDYEKWLDKHFPNLPTAESCADAVTNLAAF
ncbi:MAG: DUF4434 domain-containing protein [bacterium]|nr:DUF4434 domain-containing protein [Candidatus Sumerlaeota bacterium]